MSKTPLISVIIPYKNSLKKLDRLLRSIPIHPDLEVIVVDDASRPEEKATQISGIHSSVNFLENRQITNNAGTARNEGLKHASGYWILFADADDFFTKKAFDTIVPTAEQNPEFDCIFFKCTSMSESDGRVGSRHIAVNAKVSSYLNEKDIETLKYRWHVPWGRLIRKDLIIKNNIYFDSMTASNDVIFSARVGHAVKSVLCIEQEIYCVTTSNESLSGNLSAERALARLTVLIRYNNLMRKWNVKSSIGWGVTYFVKSKPHIIGRKKIMIYGKYISMLVRKAFGPKTD